MGDFSKSIKWSSICRFERQLKKQFIPGLIFKSNYFILIFITISILFPLPINIDMKRQINMSMIFILNKIKLNLRLT